MIWEYSEDNLIEQTAIDLFFNQLGRKPNNDNDFRTPAANSVYVATAGEV